MSWNMFSSEIDPPRSLPPPRHEPQVVSRFPRSGKLIVLRNIYVIVGPRKPPTFPISLSLAPKDESTENTHDLKKHCPPVRLPPARTSFQDQDPVKDQVLVLVLRQVLVRSWVQDQDLVQDRLGPGPNQRPRTKYLFEQLMESDWKWPHVGRQWAHITTRRSHKAQGVISTPLLTQREIQTSPNTQ